MCRILFLKWTNKQKAIDYVDAFYKAGYNDPHLEYVAKTLWVPKVKNQHIHGWWYLLVTENSVDTYLNWQAFFDDKKWFSNLKDKINNLTWEFMLMSELRITDEGHVSSFNSHPFNFISKNGYEWYLFYNWLLDYKKLAELEWINYDYYKNKNGTTIMGLSISSELDKWVSIKEAIQAPKKALKSWYNLMTFVNNNRWEFKAFVNAYSIPELLKDKKIFAYYKLIKKEEKDIFFAWSSVVWEYLDYDFKDMKNWELLEFNIDFINEFYFSWYDEK